MTRYAGIRIAIVLIGLSLVGTANAADVIWDGSSSANWSDTANWTTNSLPGSGDVVRFDQNSQMNLTINNDVAGVSIMGFANTSLAANNGPSGPMTITGNAITLGSEGIHFGTGNPLDPTYPGPAQANLTVDVDLTLSADQRWKSGGPGTATTAQPGGQQSVIVGASPNGRTVSLNGFRPTVTMHSNPLVMVIVNSKLVDGSAASSVRISKVSGSATTYVLDTGNLNNNPRVRITGDNTYSAGTDIIGGRQLIQLGTSTVMSGPTIVSGPLGTGTMTVSDTAGNDQGAFLVAWGADRTLNNPIAFTATGTALNFASTLDDTQHTLTLGGDISVATTTGNATLWMNTSIGVSNNQRNGSGDVVINGNIAFTGSGGTLTLGHGGATPSAGVVVGKQIINGNIQETAGSNAVAITSSSSTAVTAVVQLSGQNTYANGTTLTAIDSASPTASANLGLGSSTVLDGGGNIISGPLGLGTLSIGSASLGTTSSIEALGGARTVANPISLTLLQSNLVVKGSNDLTLSGAINDFGGVTKNGTGKLTLSGTNNYIGATTVNEGTLLVNGSLTGTSGVTVAAGATLGGTGTIAGPGSVTSTGTIAPGASIGTLTISNSLTLENTSSLSFELGAGGSHDLINVGSGLTLPSSGGTVTVNLVNAGGMGAGTFPLIDYAAALNGDFSTLMLGTQPAGFSYNLINNTSNTSIDLQVTATGLPGDYNSDGKVDAADYVVWRKNETANNPLPNDNGLTTQAARFDLWRGNFGNMSGSGSGAGSTNNSSVPEPGTLALLACALGTALGASNRPAAPTTMLRYK